MQYELPEYQVALLKEIAAVNSNVIAVVMNGGAVAMPWADEVKAILECFYGGQGIGRAIVKVISGEVNSVRTYACVSSGVPGTDYLG